MSVICFVCVIGMVWSVCGVSVGVWDQKVQVCGGIGGWVSVCALCNMHVWECGTVYTIAITDLRVIGQVR